MTADLLLENARIVDGTGAPWFRGAVAIDNDRITAIHRGQSDITATERVDVDGNVVAPGFIDTHSHSDLRLFNDPGLAPKVRQGITTEIFGQDGFSMAPMYRDAGSQEWEDHLSGLNGRLNGDWPWTSMGEYLDAIDANGIALNVATLVGHGTVRYNVLGMTDTAPTAAELDEMTGLLTEALEDGAIGLSTGLVYTPCIYSDTEELQALAAELARFGRPFVAHIRSERARIWEALDEFITIGATAGIPLHLSHFKLGGTPQHGLVDQAIGRIEAARARGIDFTADQYPYTAGSTTLSYVLPPWVHADGPEQTLAYLSGPDARARIRADITDDRLPDWENPGAASGWENIVVTSVATEENTALEGMSIAEIAAARDTGPVRAVMDLLAEEDIEVGIINHFLDEADVRTILEYDRVNVATDGLFGGKPHPRVYGTYPRILETYVRNENVLTLEEAIRKMTSLPARAMGLVQKGIIRPGMDADLVVFDPDRVGTTATFDDPKQYPSGIPHVIVAGEFVVQDGERTNAFPGRAIRVE